MIILLQPNNSISLLRQHRRCTGSPEAKKYSILILKMTAMQRNYFIALVVFFSIGATASAQIIKSSANQLSNADITLFKNQQTTYAQLQTDLQKLEQQKASLLELMNQYNEKQKLVVVKMQKLETIYDSINVQSKGNAVATGKSSGSQDQLLNATKKMQETQMSFNLQYLQLQSQMQHENRTYTAISNIMKTKHDTVKNSISNVR